MTLAISWTPYSNGHSTLLIAICRERRRCIWLRRLSIEGQKVIWVQKYTIPLANIWEELEQFLNNTLETYWCTEIMDISLPAQRRRWAIKLWTWVRKFYGLSPSYLTWVRFRKHCWSESTHWPWVLPSDCTKRLGMKTLGGMQPKRWATSSIRTLF